MEKQAEISEKEMTLLCEYLDDALSIKDRAKFEKRMQQSPELKQALEDMTALKHSMRSLPCKPVPHHFTLTRGEAEKARRGRFLLPTFGWASVVSMMLLAVIFGSEFIFSSFSAPQTVAEPLAMTMQSEVAPENAMRDAQSEGAQPVYLLNWVSVGGKGGGGAGGSGLIAGGYATGMGGGPAGIIAGDLALGEEVQPVEPPQAEQIVEPTPTPSMPAEEKVSVEPLIFGVREDQLGQVITIEPDENPAPAVAAAPQIVAVEKEPLIPTNVKLILVGLAAAFGLVWLLLKFRR